MTFDELTKLIECFDLTYDYSDDIAVWRRGRHELATIINEAQNFPVEDVERVWNENVDRKLIPEVAHDFYWKRR